MIMEKILAMRQERANLVNKARDLVEKAEKEKRDFTDEEQKQYDEYMEQIDTLKNKIEREEKLAGLESELDEPLNTVNKPQPNAEQKNEKEIYQNAFFKAIAGKKLTAEEQAAISKFSNAMTEGSDADGGFTVPEDIQTRIQELKQTQDNLEQYVSVESVNTDSGARTLEVRADSTPFVNVDEMAALGDMGNPQFQRITYQIKKYAGFMQVSNELFADTAENLREYIASWLAKKSKATRNSLILNILDGLTKVSFADYSDIKKALNVDLDPAIAQNAMIFTNQDGFNYLDQLEDGDGRPLLQPDPTSPTNKLLFGRRVVVLSNKTLATTDDGGGNNLYPFIVGDLKEAIVLFDRKQMTVDTTREGGEAWRKDATEIRAIEREDVKLRDADAVVYGQISVAAV